MSGLSFINSNYSQKFQSNSGFVTVVPFTFENSKSTISIFQNLAISTIIKQNDIVNITINYTRIKDDGAVGTTTAFPHNYFNFNIVGIEEYRIKDVMNTRLLK